MGFAWSYNQSYLWEFFSPFRTDRGPPCSGHPVFCLKSRVVDLALNSGRQTLETNIYIDPYWVPSVAACFRTCRKNTSATLKIVGQKQGGTLQQKRSIIDSFESLVSGIWTCSKDDMQLRVHIPECQSM